MDKNAPAAQRSLPALVGQQHHEMGFGVGLWEG